MQLIKIGNFRDDTHEKLTEKCDTLGCSITDYVIDVLNDSFKEAQNQDLKIIVEGIDEPVEVIIS